MLIRGETGMGAAKRGCCKENRLWTVDSPFGTDERLIYAQGEFWLAASWFTGGSNLFFGGRSRLDTASLELLPASRAGNLSKRHVSFIYERVERH